MGGGEGRAGLRILALEPYYGGSHQSFIDTLRRRSRHEISLLTLPARKWKWRMRGSALWFARELRNGSRGAVDLILVSDMVSVADLRALLPRRLADVPVVCYFHENQLTYPLPPTESRDYQYGFTNITTCLASDEVWFNSASHRKAFLDAAEQLLRKMPDYHPAGVIEEIAERSRVQWPPMEEPPERHGRGEVVGGAPTILWNHRWEYDKGPEAFFDALYVLDSQGVDFRLVVLGESFRAAPASFRAARGRLGHRIDQWGFVRSRDEYWRWLRRSDIVVSTAIQENFGYSVVEAVLSGCFPVLPNRLSYPELIPDDLRETHLYDGDEELAGRLARCLAGGRRPAVDPRVTGRLRSRCGASACIAFYDKELRRVASWAGGARKGSDMEGGPNVL